MKKIIKIIASLFLGLSLTACMSNKPYIGENERPLTTEDMKKAVRINRTAEVLMVVLTALSLWLCH